MANTYLTRTAGTPTSTQKGTFSAWVKRSSSADARIFTSWGGGSRQFWLNFQTDSTDSHISIADYDGSYNLRYLTNRKFRDFSAWYNVVFAIDTTLGTAGDRVKLYINGVQETSFSVSTAPSQNQVLNFATSGDAHIIGKRDAEEYFNGSMSYVAFIDGKQELPTIFGETDATTGEWKIKTTITPTSGWGNNGFFILKNGNSVTDQSGNSNNFTVGGGTLTKTEDSPSNVFATINPLYYSSTGLLNGNVTATSTGNSHKNYHSSIGVGSGKWYAEMKVNSWNGSNNIMFGIVADSWDNINKTSPGDNFAGNASTGIGYGSNGQKIIANSASSYGNSFTTGDILGIALDLTNNKLYFSKNGTYQNSGVPTSGSTGTGAIDVPSGFTRLITFSHYGSQSCSMNFGNGYFGTTAVSSAGTNASGNGIFEYDVPANFTAISTKGLNL